MNTVGQAWARHAACASTDVAQLPWVADPRTINQSTTAQMATVCQGCLVIAECAHTASDALAGFWAGQFRTPTGSHNPHHRFEVMADDPSTLTPGVVATGWVRVKTRRSGASGGRSRPVWDQAVLLVGAS